MTVHPAVSLERAASAERSSPGRISSSILSFRSRGTQPRVWGSGGARMLTLAGEHAPRVEGGTGSIPAPDHLHDLAADRGHRLLARHVLHAGLVMGVATMRRSCLTRGSAIWLTIARNSGRPVRAILVWPTYLPLFRRGHQSFSALMMRVTRSVERKHEPDAAGRCHIFAAASHLTRTARLREGGDHWNTPAVPVPA